MRNPEGVAGRIMVALAIEQGGKRDLEPLLELRGAVLVILRYGDDRQRAGGDAVQKRQRQLANRATDFIKREQHRAALQNLLERLPAAAHAIERELRRDGTGGDHSCSFSWLFTN